MLKAENHKEDAKVIIITQFSDNTATTFEKQKLLEMRNRDTLEIGDFNTLVSILEKSEEKTLIRIEKPQLT